MFFTRTKKPAKAPCSDLLTKLSADIVQARATMGYNSRCIPKLDSSQVNCNVCNRSHKITYHQPIIILEKGHSFFGNWLIAHQHLRAAAHRGMPNHELHFITPPTIADLQTMNEKAIDKSRNTHRIEQHFRMQLEFLRTLKKVAAEEEKIVERQFHSAWILRIQPLCELRTPLEDLTASRSDWMSVIDLYLQIRQFQNEQKVIDHNTKSIESLLGLVPEYLSQCIDIDTKPPFSGKY